MTDNTAKMTENFTALLDPDTADLLTRLHVSLHMSKAAVVRDLIRRRAEMDFANHPVCANGGACRAPHAFVYGPANLPAPPDPDRPL